MKNQDFMLGVLDVCTALNLLMNRMSKHVYVLNKGAIMPELTPGLIEDKIKAYNEAKEEYNKWVGMLGTSDAETRGDDLEKGNLNNAFKAFEEVHKDAEAFVEKHRNTLTPGSHLSSLNTLVNENAATFTGPRQDFTPDPGGRSVGAVRPSRRM